MRILTIHNRYQLRGGEEECYEAEVSLLQQMGHEVEIYEENNNRLKGLNTAALAARTVWSQKTYQDVRRCLKATIIRCRSRTQFFSSNFSIGLLRCESPRSSCSSDFT